MKEYIKLLRPAHWIKNLLVFLPLIFSGFASNTDAILSCLAAFGIFCMTASAVYAFNDARDAETDAKIPSKAMRPVASGAISKNNAYVIAGLLAILSLCCSWILCGLWGLVVVACYLVFNVAYSLGLKDYPIIDIVLLASGYLLRVLFGGLAIDVAVSGWLYLTVLCAAFYLGLGKRVGEMKSSSDVRRKVLSFYTQDFLVKNMYMFLGLTNAFFALWAKETGTGMLAAVPVALVLSMRYAYDIEQGGTADPVDVILKDKWLLLLAALLVALPAVMIYMF